MDKIYDEIMGLSKKAGTTLFTEEEVKKRVKELEEAFGEEVSEVLIVPKKREGDTG